MHPYKGSYQYNTIDDRPLLGLTDDLLHETESNHSSLVDNDDNDYYNEKYEEQALQLLDDFENLLPKNSEVPVEKCDSPKDNQHDDPLPPWYKRKLNVKIREATDTLEILSNMVCNVCPTVAVHIKRIEQDHSAIFCKMDFPRHPPMNKPWTNSWKFNCAVKCKNTGNPTHTHTSNCKSEVVLEHVDTGVSTATPNICQNEYPIFVMDAVELFQDFANQNINRHADLASKTTLWSGIKVAIRSNYKNKLMMIVRGKKVGPIKYQLKKYFKYGPGQDSDMDCVFCLDQAWNRNINKIEAEKLYGLYQLRDKIGSVLIDYKPKISVDFNSIEIIHLGQIIKDYAGLTMETTLLDIGCNFGVLSLMMSDECERVFGINTMHAVNNDLHQAEQIKDLNKIKNVSFIGCNPEDIITRCGPFIKGCITVAVVNLATPYGKSKHTMEALRNIPSIWRVIIYGPFAKEHCKNIVKLTTENDANGDHFLPMQGCILDKSPSAENAFDIVILFERPSLITPKLKLEVLTSGPTVNIKLDSELGKYEPLDEQELKPKLSVDRNQNFENSEERYRKLPLHSSSSSGSSKRSIRSPSPRSVRSPSPRRSTRPLSPRRSTRPPSPKRSQLSSSPRRFQRSSLPRRSVRSPSPKRSRVRSPSPSRSQRSFSPRRSQRSPSSIKSHYSPSSRRSQRSLSPIRSHVLSPSPRRSTTSDRYSDRSVQKQKWHSVPPIHKEKDTSYYRSNSNDFKIKTELTENRLPLRNQNRSPSSSSHEKPYDCLALDTNYQLKKEKNQSLHEENSQDKISSHYPLLSVRKEFQFSYPSSPREKPPTPPADISLHINSSQIKKEEVAGWNIPSWTSVVTELELELDKQESVLNDEVQNSETAALSYPSNFLGDNYKSIPLSIIVKSEPVDTYEVSLQQVTSESVPLLAKIKSEPVDSYKVPYPYVANENYVLPPITYNSESVENHNVYAQLGADGNANLPVTVKSEPVDTHESRHENSSKLVDDGNLFVPLPIIIKSEPFEVPSQETVCEDLQQSPNTVKPDIQQSTKNVKPDIQQSMNTVKPEPVDPFKVPALPIKSEPQNNNISEVSLDTQDFQNLKTPIHNPRSVSSSANKVFANFDEFEFAVDATRSYMTLPRDPEPPTTPLDVKKEPTEKEHLEKNEETVGEKLSEQQVERGVKIELEEGGYHMETDQKIEIINEKIIDTKPNVNLIKTEPEDDGIKIISVKKRNEQTESKPNIYIKTEDKLKVEENDDDLRELIKQRKKLLEILGQENEIRHPKELPRSYKRHSSPSPPSRFSKKYHRSPSSRRSGRSPSSYRHRSPSSKRLKRSPRRSRRSPSPSYRHSRRSPVSPIRVKSESYSSDCSSSNNRKEKKRKRSPSTFKSEIYSRTSRKRSRSKSPKRKE